MHVIMNHVIIEYVYEPLKYDEYALNKDDKDRHAIVDKAKPSRPSSHTKSYRQLRNPRQGKGGLPQGRAH